MTSSRLRRPAGALLATAVATSIFAIIPAAHAADGTVTGTVTGPGGVTDPLEFIDVAAMREVPNGSTGETYWENVDFASTDAAGDYEFAGLPDGTYRFEFGDRLNPNPYASEFYDDQATVVTATDVLVVSDTARTNVDAQLALESTISGTVTGAANEPLEGAGVFVYERANGEWAYLDEVTTDGAGEYTLSHLPRGTYRVEFQYETPSGEYLSEAYNNKAYVTEADDIVVTEDVDVTAIDAQLIAGEHDPLYLEGVTIPMISGTPQVGQTLSVTAGTWTPSDITATYQWYNDDGAIAGAIGTTYVPTASDVGKTLVVLVDASKPGYESRTNMSNVVGPIAAVPVVTPAPVPAPAPVPVPEPVPVISFSKKIDVVGSLTVGSTLKLKNFKALVSRAVVSYKVQWFAGSKKIKKATKPKLKVTKALKGKKIFVKVSATVDGTTKTVKVKVGKIR